jgi:hypothetical protein
MNLEDFFKSAAHRKPVSPRPITFTIGTKDKVLPGGLDNPTGQYVKATVTAAFVFVDVEDTQKARQDAKVSIVDALAGKDKNAAPARYDEGEFEYEVQLQLLQRALRVYTEKTKEAGGVFFPAVNNIRKLMVPREVSRVYAAYTQYVADEHPEVVDTETFRKPQEAGPRVSVSQSG